MNFVQGAIGTVAVIAGENLKTFKCPLLTLRYIGVVLIREMEPSRVPSQGFLAEFILSETEGLEMTTGDKLFPWMSFRTPGRGEKSLIRIDKVRGSLAKRLPLLRRRGLREGRNRDFSLRSK